MKTRDAAPQGTEGEKGPSKLRTGAKRVKRWLYKTIALLLVALVVVIGAWTWIALGFAYSRGERAGYLQKLSKKGWIFKTWEGELAMVNLPGAMPEIFNFSIRDDAVAAQLEASLGKRVRLRYEEHVGIPVNWFGETPFFVVGIENIADAEPPK